MASTAHGLQLFTSILNNANTTIGSSLLPPISGAQAAATGLYNALLNQGAPGSLLNDVSDFSVSTAALSGQLTGVSSLLSSTTVALNRVPSTSAYGSDVFWGAIGTLAGLAALLVVSLSGLIAKPAFATCLRCYLAPLVLVLAIVWALAGVFIALAVVGSDVCYAPSAAVLSLLNTTGSSAESAASTIAFYTTPCGTGGNATGSYAELVEGQQQALACIADLVDLNASIAAINDPALSAAAAPYLGPLAFNTYGAIAGINETLAAVSCPVVYGAFVQVRGLVAAVWMRDMHRRALHAAGH